MLYRKLQHADLKFGHASAHRTLMLKLIMELAAVFVEMENLNVGNDMKEEKDSQSVIKGLSSTIKFSLIFYFLFLLFYRSIELRECTQPHCLYGIYSSSNGRCPDKNEKMRRGFQRPK